MASESSMQGDPFLLGMFRDELASAAVTLDTGLRESGLSGNLEPLVRAAHSIRGAARIVGIDPVADLAGAMEHALDAIRKGTAAPDPATGDTIIRATALFLELAAITEAVDIPAAIETRGEDIGALAGSLKAGPSPEPASAPAPAPEPSPAPARAAAPPAAPEPLPPGGGVDAADLFMMDLFRVEVENHTRSLESGLVDAERDPSPERMEPLMRASHSIKGAARIVGLAGAVRLAHAMEDVLEASRKGTLALQPGHIDLLLRANDIFASLVPVAPEEIPARLAARAEEMDEVARLLAESMTLLPGAPASTTASVPASPSAPAPAPAAAPPRPTPVSAPQKEPAAREERSVRVLAENLDRLIGLAGESLVQAKTTKSFSQSMLRIKNIQTELAGMLEELVLSPKYGNLSEEAFHAIGEALKLLDQLQDVLIRQIDQFERLSRRLEFHAERLYSEVVANRMRPFADGLHGFPRLVRDLSQSLGKKVSFSVEGGSTRVDRDILERLEAPLNHLIRNALDHGIETPDARTALGKPAEGKIVLDARHFFGVLNITLTDDGRGIDPERIREAVVRKGLSVEEMARNMNLAELFDFLFLPGFSTAKNVTEVSGRGVGLDVVASMVHEVGGTVRVESKVGEGTTFHLQLPLTLSVLRTLIVEIAGEFYALPLSRIDRVLEIDPSRLHVVEDRQFCTVDGDHIGVIDAREILQTPPAPNSSERLSIAIISDRLTRYGIVVDRFRGERELVVRPLDPQLGKIPNVSSGAILGDGSPVLILDVDDLVRSIDNRLTHGRLHRVGGRGPDTGAVRKRVLVVEDSLTVRQVERKLLENDGYEVTVAVDGMDGWNALQGDRFDLVVSDVDMPRMNGIELVRRIREDPKYRDIPVMIISYKDREEDRLKGLEAGASYYLSKGSFHDESLIRAVRDLIGEP